jgi:hypothetical protein
VLRITSMKSGPGARITRVAARANPSRAVVTGPSYAGRRRPVIAFSWCAVAVVFLIRYSLVHSDTG